MCITIIKELTVFYKDLFDDITVKNVENYMMKKIIIISMYNFMFYKHDITSLYIL
jgi:hypothetical protein